MRKAIVMILVLAAAIACGSSVQAALVFNADFRGDGTYDTSWPMKAGDVVTVDIYVSNVPEPGLISMGFKLTFDSNRLEVVTTGTVVDSLNWPDASHVDFVDVDEDGDVDEIDMAGFLLLESGEDQGHIGDDIKLGTVTFRCVSAGSSAFMLLRREGSWFVLFSEDPNPNNWTVLDGDIGTGVLLATIRPPMPGDVNGDESVDLADAIFALKVMAGMGQGNVFPAADVNNDGEIGLSEVLYVLQRYVGLRQ